MVISRGVRVVSAEDIPLICEQAAREGVPVFTLSTAGRTDKDSFFEAVRRTLPLDPPLRSGSQVWDALSDSLWGGLDDLEASRVVIVWPDARLRRSTRGDAGIALDILRDVAETLADVRYTAGRPTQVAVYVALP